MSSSKIILKSALITLVTLIGAALVAFAVLSLAFPSAMAKMCEKTNNYSFAVRYAALSYTYSGDGEDVARCVEDAISSGKSSLVVKYGGKFLSHPQFSEVCDKKTEEWQRAFSGNADIGQQVEERNLVLDYRFYICGEIAVARYTRGDMNGALEAAEKGCENYIGFPAGNPYVQLALKVVAENDAQGKAELKSALDEKFGSETGEYFTGVYDLLK